MNVAPSRTPNDVAAFEDSLTAHELVGNPSRHLERGMT
jgi:hypothetical protein